jgi:hypothetical protein
VQRDRTPCRHSEHGVQIGRPLVAPKVRVLDRPWVLEPVPIIPAARLPEFRWLIALVGADHRVERQIAEPLVSLCRLAVSEYVRVGVVVVGAGRG